LDDLANISLDGGPVVVAGERGENFGVRKVLEVGMVLADEGFT
jgi:hypothetical protein